jgi:formamidopyrimidine-DNA glycosylase
LPELPEVEVIARHLKSKLSGLTICSFRIVYPAILKKTNMAMLLPIKGQEVCDVRRRGKCIWMKTDGGMSVIFHLKMTGQFLFCLPREPWDKHTHFGLAFLESSFELRFRDVRKFGWILCTKARNESEVEAFDQLGPEPLEIERDQFVELFRGRKARMKSLLLDQTFLAGIGNIYADEILFRAKVHPACSAAFLNEEDLFRVWDAMNHILRSAIAHRGSSIRDFVDADGREGSYQDQHRVYGRQGLSCPECSHPISRLRIGGRSSYVCSLCQTPPKSKRPKKIPQ